MYAHVNYFSWTSSSSSELVNFLQIALLTGHALETYFHYVGQMVDARQHFLFRVFPWRSNVWWIKVTSFDGHESWLEGNINLRRNQVKSFHFLSKKNILWNWRVIYPCSSLDRSYGIIIGARKHWIDLRHLFLGKKRPDEFEGSERMYEHFVSSI